MKRILFILFLLCSLAASAQKYIPFYNYGVEYPRIKTDSALHFPRKYSLQLNTTDTTPQGFVKGNDLFWYSNGQYYKATTGGLTSFRVYGQYPIVAVNDSTLKLDTLWSDGRYILNQKLAEQNADFYIKTARVNNLSVINNTGVDGDAQLLVQNNDPNGDAAVIHAKSAGILSRAYDRYEVAGTTKRWNVGLFKGNSDSDLTFSIGYKDGNPINLVDNPGYLNFRTNGRLGLGTLTPTAKLHVLGTGIFSDTLTITTLAAKDSSNRAASTRYADRAIATAIAAIPPGSTDAATLQGHNGAYYLNYANLTGTPTIPTNNNQLTNGAGYETLTHANATFATISSLNSYLLKSDTAAMLSTYLRKTDAAGLYYPLTGNPSGFLTSASIAGKLNISDTATMLTPYLRQTDAAGLYVAKVTGKGLSTEDYTTAEKTKLSGIATGATANSTDAFLLARANHTGTQAESTVTGLISDLAGKEDASNKTATQSSSAFTYPNWLGLTNYFGTLSGIYQPLENQRLSTSNAPTFAGLTSNGILNLIGLTGTPTAPASGTQRIYADSTGAFTMQGSNSYAFSISKARLTGNHRVYPQNKDYTIADSSDVAANTASIATNTANIATNTSNIAANTIAITARQKIARPSLIAAIGDSRLGNSLNLASTVPPVQLNWSNQGILTWFMYLTNQKYDLPYTYDLAVSGYTTAQILATVPSVLALNPLPRFCIVNGGTNSISASVSLLSMESDFQSIASQLIAGGVTPVFMTDAPRLVSTWTTAMNRQHHALNNWLRKWCRDNGYSLADAEAAITVQATGEPAYNISDGIHQNITGGYLQGNELANVFNAIASVRADTRMQSVYDVYDATYNPYGNLLGTIGLIQGTTGTNTGTGASGTVATGWNNRVVSGTATSVASKENPRSDGLMGDRQILAISSVSATTVIRFSPVTNISASSTTYQAGDTLIAEADIEVSAGSSLLDYVHLYLQEINASSAFLGGSTAFKGVTSTAFPMPTAGYSGRLRTIPFISQATTNNVILRVEAQVETGGSATIKVGNATIRKVHTGDGTIL